MRLPEWTGVQAPSRFRIHRDVSAFTVLAVPYRDDPYVKVHGFPAQTILLVPALAREFLPVRRFLRLSQGNARGRCFLFDVELAAQDCPVLCRREWLSDK